MFISIKRKAQYAINSKSWDLLFEAYGMAKMARLLDAITMEEFMVLNEMIIVNCVNNPQATKDWDR